MRGPARDAARIRVDALLDVAPLPDQAPPAYPSRARTRGWEGRTLLRVAIDASGHPTAATVATSSPTPLLDRAAQKAVLRWRFRLAHRHGVAVASVLELPIRFVLTDPGAAMAADPGQGL